MSFARLQEKIDALKNPTVAGLDPDLEHIPPQVLEKYYKEHGETLEAASMAVMEFNCGLIDALSDIVPAVKPQSAYYEILGPYGVMALHKTCEYAKSKGMYVIVDGKRNDIGSTASAYSTAYLGAVKIGSTEYKPFDVDALTVNAYLGSDGIKPFIETAVKYDKAVFALVKTSNPSAGELQDKLIGNGAQGDGSPVLSEKSTGEPSPCALYTAVGDLMEEISKETIDKNGYSCVGAVVGATYPEEAKLLRERLKHTFFLVPGYGAQGGSAETAANTFDKNGKGAIVNSSRAIIAAWKKTGGDYKAAAREEALKMRDELRKVVKNST
ncbi:MAG: orotidine-5'-phosphate decarboxylase [Oscillospiraceae bacterium]|nr:orotidine-5'-phosphate decarboxylase [Oscillospiraceae bacterium]